jgi:ribonuclease HI
MSLATHVWNTIWSLRVPVKIHHFLWRACHESLPTRKNLHHRHVQADSSCVSCNKAVESVLHALWQCNSLNEIWLAVPWGCLLKGDQYLDFMELMLCCIRSLSTSELQLFAMITWSIWYRRNCHWRNQPIDTNDQLLQRAQRTLGEFLEAQESPNLPSRTTEPQIRTKWKPPLLGRYKVNYDGAMFEESSEAGIGVIIRNNRGEVMASMCHRIHYPHLTEAMEAYAARSATQLAIDLGFKEVDIKGDPITIVTALRNTAPCCTLYGHLVNDTKNTANSFLSVQFLHVKRDGNSVAHSLAKRAKFSNPFEVWMESVPPDIVPILCNDFSNHQ